MDQQSVDQSSFTLKPFETSPTFAKLFEALAKVQSEMKPAVLDKQNPHYNSWYASLSSCREACQEPMGKHNVAYTQPVFWFDGHYYIRTMIVHGSEWLASTLKLTLSKQDMQGLGSAITYAKRYALSATIGIVDTDDDDGNEAVNIVKVPPKHRQEPPRVAPPQQTKFSPAPKPTTVESPKPVQANLLGDSTASPLDNLIDTVEQRGIPYQEMPGIIKMAIGFEKKAKELNPDEIKQVLNTIKIFWGRVTPSSENGRGQVVTDKPAPTSTDEEIQYEL